MKDIFPILEKRTAKEFKEEAIKRIKKMYPNWDIDDPSDIGNMLVEIFSWYAEMIAYKMNQIPSRLYENFVGLLGVKPHKAIPSKTVTHFHLKPEGLKEFKKLEAKTLQSPKGLNFEMVDYALVSPIRLNKIYKIDQNGDEFIWKESIGDYYSACFKKEGIILNQLQICFDDPTLTNLDLAVQFSIQLTYHCSNEVSQQILKDWFMKGEYLLETDDGYAKPLKDVDVEFTGDSIRIQIPGGNSDYSGSKGKIWCKKIFPIDVLKKFDCTLEKPRIEWENSLNPVRLTQYWDAEQNENRYFGEPGIYFKPKSVNHLLIPGANRFDNQKLRLRIKVDSNPNKKRADIFLRWKILVAGGKELLFQPADDKNNLEPGKFLDNTAQFHHSGIIEFALPNMTYGNKDQENREDQLVVVIENIGDEDKYYGENFIINEILAEYSGFKNQIHSIQIFCGKNEVFDADTNQQNIQINGNLFHSFSPGIYMYLTGKDEDELSFNSRFFVELSEDISYEKFTESLNGFSFSREGLMPVTIKMNEFFPGYGVVLDVGVRSSVRKSLLGLEGHWVVFSLAETGGIEKIYENCVVSYQYEKLDKFFLGKLEPVVYHSFQIDQGLIVQLEAVEIWYENQLVRVLEYNSGELKINFLENSLEFHGEDLLHWAGAEVFVRGLVLCKGEEGNLPQEILQYRGKDRKYFDIATNIIPAVGGKDSESFEELKLRVPDILSSREKVITSADYEAAAMKLCPDINRVKAKYNHKLNMVELWVLPRKGFDNQRQWRSMVENLTQHLKKKSVINTDILVTTPKIKKLRAEIVIHIRINQTQKEEFLYFLKTFLKEKISPYGNQNYHGWPFGRPVKNSVIVSMLYRFQEIQFVQEVFLYEMKAGGISEPKLEVRMEDNELPLLEEIELQTMEIQGVFDDENIDI